jgi:hypothetical protein
MKVLKNFANYFQCSPARKSDIVKPNDFSLQLCSY